MTGAVPTLPKGLSLGNMGSGGTAGMVSCRGAGKKGAAWGNIALRISLGEITPTTPQDSIAASADWRYIDVHTAQRCSLNPLNTFPTPKVKFTWVQRPWWRTMFGYFGHFDFLPILSSKLVSQAAVFVTSHNSTPHEREGKREERCVTRQKRGGGRLLISWILITQLWTHEQ